MLSFFLFFLSVLRHRSQLGRNSGRNKYRARRKQSWYLPVAAQAVVDTLKRGLWKEAINREMLFFGSGLFVDVSAIRARDVYSYDTINQNSGHARISQTLITTKGRMGVQNHKRCLLRKRAGTLTSATLQRNTVRDHLVLAGRGLGSRTTHAAEEEATRVTLLATSVIAIHLRIFFPRSWTHTID